jgi:hypothetical protein
MSTTSHDAAYALALLVALIASGFGYAAGCAHGQHDVARKACAASGFTHGYYDTSAGRIDCWREVRLGDNQR